MRGNSVCGRVKDSLIGLTWAMVTKAEFVPLEVLTMLPGWIRTGPVLPSTGARIWV